MDCFSVWKKKIFYIQRGCYLHSHQKLTKTVFLTSLQYHLVYFLYKDLANAITNTRACNNSISYCTLVRNYTEDYCIRFFYKNTIRFCP